MKTPLLWMTAAVLLALPARAQDASTPGALEVHANFRFAGVRLPISGDADGDAAVELELRRAGGDWRAGHRLLRTAGDTFIGSLFFLEPDSRYELRLTLRDPDNDGPLQVSGELTTRVDAVPAPAAPQQIFVAPGGDDGGPGSQAEPLGSIQAAVDRAGPGTVVRVAAGVYREAVEVTRSGEPGAPIVILAAPGAVLDGADAAIQSGAVAWTELEDGIYWAPYAGDSWYAAFGDAGLATRLYDYHALDDLRSESGGQPGQSGVLAGGFFVDGDQGRVYLRLPDRSDPAASTIHLAARRGGLLVDGAHDVVIDGFEIRCYGSHQYGFGVDLRGAQRVWVRNCHIHNLNSGVRLRRGAAGCVVEHNRIADSSVFSWPWASVKAHNAEASGISVGGGRGNVVRHNTIDGPFNGIYVGEFSDDPDPELAAETDVVGNILRHLGDDGLEPEGACINVRFVDNRILEVHNGVSLAPIQVGPTWLVGTLVAGYRAHALKLNNGSSGPILVYHSTGLPAAGFDGAQAWAPSVPFGPLWSQNNLWAARRYVIEYGPDSLLAPVAMDHDAWDTSRGPPIVKWLGQRYDTLEAFRQATGLQAHGIYGPPELVDPAAGDFRPAAGSPLIDAGGPIPGINDAPGRVPDGRPDIGALERGGAVEPDGGPDAGPDAGSDAGPDAGDPHPGDTDPSDAGPDAGDAEPADSHQPGADPTPDSVSGSCGCRHTTPNPWPLALLLLATALRRRG